MKARLPQGYGKQSMAQLMQQAQQMQENVKKKQEELDYAKASLILFDDFRSGKTGRITLEWAPV